MANTLRLAPFFVDLAEDFVQMFLNLANFSSQGIAEGTNICSHDDTYTALSYLISKSEERK